MDRTVVEPAFSSTLEQIPISSLLGMFAEVIEQVSKGYSMGWSERTIKTKARRLSTWLTFTELAEEQEAGILEVTKKMPRDDLSDPASETQESGL